MAKSREQTEFGDFQTPPALSAAVCRKLAELGIKPAAILEPTCGRGNLLTAAARHFSTAAQVMGVEVNPVYAEAARDEMAGISSASEIVVGDFFDVDWNRLLEGLSEPLLVLGNPPWVTSAELGTINSGNLPTKSNFHARSGIDALMGKSNFDISEWMLIQMLGWMAAREGTIAMLCKTSVARKVLSFAWLRQLPLASASLYEIDAQEHFGAAVDACLLVLGFHDQIPTTVAPVYTSLEDLQPRTTVGWRDDQLVSNVDAYERLRHLRTPHPRAGLPWRSGVKHDCSRVMELTGTPGQWRNKLNEEADIELEYAFPLLKSSDIARGRKTPRYWTILTQLSVRDSVEHIAARAPKTWQYLLAHADLLDARRSSIYRNLSRFSMFGIGDYTFAPWKVAISGMYKQLHFEVIGGYDGKPMIFDDTVNFVPCATQEEANFLAELLNSEIAKEFLSSLVFWDSKRPITVDLLKRIDIRSLARELKREFSYDWFASNNERQKQLF